MLTISNPKAILFYVALFPAFVELKDTNLIDMLKIMLCSTIAFGTVNLGFSYFASVAGSKLNNSSHVITINKIASLVMLSVGISIALKT